MISSKHARCTRITTLLWFKLLAYFTIMIVALFGLTACSSTPEELQMEIEQIETEYEAERVAELNELFSESSYSGEFSNLILSVSIDLEKEESALGYDIGKLTENVSIIVCMDDEYDSWSFKEQYDFADGLFSEIVPTYKSNRWDDCFVEYYYKENSTNYDKAYDLEYTIYDSYDSDLSFCIQTTHNKYYCSDTFGGDYFRINEKEYYSSIFEKAYGTYTSYPCSVCDKEGVHVYESFTGQTEFYCTTHYLEILDMLDAMGAD